MLLEARTHHTGQAWLLFEGRRKSIKIQAFAGRPSTHKLNFFAPDFALSSPKPWLIGEEVKWSDGELLGLPFLVQRVRPDENEFGGQHQDILDHISRHEFQKAVAVVFEDLEFAAPLEARMFSRALRPGQFTYGFEFLGEGICGCTPELLFRVEGQKLFTMALAGTALSTGPSLLEDPKERHEHQLVIDHIAEELKIYGVVNVGVTEERTYGKLKHLYTPVSVDLARPPEFMDLVRSLHPTAALGGWPKKSALEWLGSQSFHSMRKRFGAPFGYQHGEQMVCVVAIRGIQWWGTRARTATGCGVVEQSIVRKEWKELELKREAIYQMLGVSL